ncbi:MAG: hypothetical protein J7J72_01120, partial [Bacteroidales bacterium]|nr:hypothetical protein [Bacteroidales bacterium]
MGKSPKKKITKEGLQNVFKLWGYIRPFWKEYLLGMFFLLGSSLANLAFPKLLGDIVKAGGQGLLEQTLNQTVLFLIVVLIIQSVF